MPWLSRNNIQPTDSLTADMLNSLANDTRFWGGDVNAGGYKLTNVILSGSGGFERAPSPAVIAPVAAGGSSEVQLADYVAGTPDTFPPRWKMAKAADPVPDFSIERYSAGGSLIDKPLSIRMADGIVVLRAQQWVGPVNAEGQTLSNVIIGGTSTVPWDAVVGEPASFPPGPHTHAAADTVSGVFAVARLGTGSPSASNYLRGDGVWSTVAQQTPWTSDVDAARHSLLNAERVVALGDGGLITAMDFNINRDVNGNRLMAGPAALFRVDAANSNIFMALYPNGAAGTAVSDPSFPLNFVPGVRVAIGAWNLTKTEVDSPYFKVPRIVQPGDMYHSWNVEDVGGQWKHLAAGYGNVITSSMTDGNLRFYITGNGTVGGFASLAAIALFGPSTIRFQTNQFTLSAIDSNANAWTVFTPYNNQNSARFGVGMTGDTTRYFIARYNDSGVWIDDPISINRATGVVTITTLDKASLGTGTPDSTKYLRGDGIWAVPPGAGGGQPQTPWAQNIDGAGYHLTNAGLISGVTGQFKGDATAAMTGAGVELFYFSNEGRVQVYDRTGGAWKALRLLGSPVSIWDGGTESLRVTAGRTTVVSRYLYPQQVCMGNDSVITWNLDESSGQWRFNTTGYGHFISGSNDGSIKFATAPSGTAGTGAAPKTIAMFRGGALLMPTLGAATFFNVDYTDTWRYQEAGPAALFRLSGNNFELWNCAAGAAGAVASVNRAFWDDGSTFVMLHRPVFQAKTTRAVSLEGALPELDFDFYRTDGGADDKYGRVIGTGAYIGLERINDAYNQVLTYARLDRSGFSSNVPHYWQDSIGLKLVLYSGGSNQFHMGIEGGTMYSSVPPGNQHRWYFGVADGGGVNCCMELTSQRLFVRGPLLQTISMGQADPLYFNNVSNAFYAYFDQSTKKIVFRIHEWGVAYRNYYLKEGDQGSGVLTYSDTGNTVVSHSGQPYYFALKNSIPFATVASATTAEIRIRFKVAISGGTGNGNIYFNPWGPYTPGQSSSALGQYIAFAGCPTGQTIEVELFVVFGAAPMALNGRSRNNNGAWTNATGFYQAQPNSCNYFQIWASGNSGMVYTTYGLEVVSVPSGAGL